MNFAFKKDTKVVLSTKVDKPFRDEIERIARIEGVKASNVVESFLRAAYSYYIANEKNSK